MSNINSSSTSTRASTASSSNTDGIKLTATYKLEGADFGPSTYKIYESNSCLPNERKNETPYLFVWLHGADMGDIDPKHLKNIQEHLDRRTFFMIPLNPGTSPQGFRFSWGVAYTKKQNKGDLGFVHGQLHTNYLRQLIKNISDRAHEVRAEKVVVCGYSMGGFGAYQLGMAAPAAFDAVISVAGYGMGTMEPPEKGYGAPQPQSSQIFQRFLRDVSRLAYVPIVIGVHAPADTISSFQDNMAIVEAVAKKKKLLEPRSGEAGVVKLIEIPDDHANSDPGRQKKKKYGHNYFNYALLDESSERVLWCYLKEKLRTEACRREELEPRTP